MMAELDTYSECDSGDDDPRLAGIRFHNPHTRMVLELGTAKNTAK